jgi:hypothetical protein
VPAPLFFAPLRESTIGGGGGGAPIVSGETPITLDEDRIVPELLAPSTLLPRSDKDDSSEYQKKSLAFSETANTTI